MANERERFARWAREAPREVAPGIPAATVVVLRDHQGALETLMLRRDSKLAFVGGMWVFPGGRVDPVDCEGCGDDALAAARRAAVREAHEEAGLLLQPEALLPFSHWTPPPITPRRFLTWFFVAPAPAGPVTIDDGEIRDHVWIRPADAMARRDAGEIEIVPPTWITLERLARHADVDSVLAECARCEPERFETHIAMTDDGPVALYREDAGWQSGDPSVPGPRHRLCMRDDGWVYERDDPALPAPRVRR